jgi:hypothetical protein
MFAQYLAEQADAVVAQATASWDGGVPADIAAAVHAYITNNPSLVISDVDLLLNGAAQARRFVIYGDNITRHARAITDAIAAVNMYTTLITTVKDRDMHIMTDGMSIVQLYGIRNDHRDAITPTIVDGIPLYPADLELIEVYHTLYDPSRHDEWTEAAALEAALVKGLGTPDAAPQSQSQSQPRKTPPQESQPRKAAIEKVRKWVSTRADAVIVMDAPNKLQVAVDTPNIDKGFIGALRNFAAFAWKGAQFVVKRHESNLSSNTRLIKWVVFVQGAAVLDIFNSAQYELIPCVVIDGVRVGHRAVQCEYMLIDLWFVRVMAAMGYLQPAAAAKSSAAILAAFHSLRTREWPPIAEWFGTYDNPDIAARKKRLRSGVQPYRPAALRRG